MGRKGNTFAQLEGMWIGAATMEGSIELPQKIKNETAVCSSDSNFGNLSEETQNTNLKEHEHLYVYCSVIYNHQDMEAAQVSINWSVDKTTMGHLYNGILLSHKKEENFTLYSSMDEPGEHYSKWDKPVRER